MTLHLPAYRLRIYAPRSVDPDEGTLLTPAAGAPHSDQFKVTTLAGVSGWLPYLGAVEGRSGKIDVLTRKCTIGSYTFHLLDPRTGTSNLSRWLSAYTGTADERPQLLGCKVYAEESLDAGATWDRFAVGRCQNQSLESMLIHGIQVRDFAEDFKKVRLFTHRAVGASTAIEPLVLPLGLSGALGEIKAAAALTGTIKAPANNSPYRVIELSAASKNRTDNIFTQDFLAQVGGYVTGTLGRILQRGTGVGSVRAARGLRVRFSSSSPSITDKELHIRRVYVDTRVEHPFSFHLAVTHLLVDALRRSDDALATDDPYYQAFDTGSVPNNTNISFTVRLIQQGTEDDEDDRGHLYFGDVGIPTHWQDCLAGKFSRKYESGDTIPSGRAVGDAVWPIPYDASAFTDLGTPVTGREALPAIRGHITKAWNAIDYIEKALCQPYGLGYRFEPVEVAGVPTCQLVPLDFRIPSVAALGSIPTLDDDDLVRDAPLDWAADATAAITDLTVKYYSDVVFGVSDVIASPDLVPSLPSSLILEAKNVYRDPTFGNFVDLDRQGLTVDAIGIRGADTWSDAVQGQQRDPWADNVAAAVGDHYRGFFAAGATEVGFTVVRNATTTALRQGDWVICDFSGWPNPSTNLRGGARLILLTSRKEAGPRMTFAGLDAGVSSGAGAPTVGTPTQTSGNTAHSIDVAITLNADGVPALVRIAVKDTSFGATPPGDDNAAWIPALLVTASATVSIRNLPSGKRVFVAASSRPTAKSGTIRELPSAWAKPSGTKYVDTATYTAPSSCNVIPEPVTGSSDCTVTWTNGETALPVEVALSTDGGTTYVVVARLDPGSVGPFTLNPYLIAGLSYRCGVRHVDALAGATAYSTDDFDVDAGWGGASLASPTLTLLQGTA